MGEAYGWSLWVRFMGEVYGWSLWVKSMGGAYGWNLWVKSMGEIDGWNRWVKSMGEIDGWNRWVRRMGKIGSCLRRGFETFWKAFFEKTITCVRKASVYVELQISFWAMLSCSKIKKSLLVDFLKAKKGQNLTILQWHLRLEKSVTKFYSLFDVKTTFEWNRFDFRKFSDYSDGTHRGFFSGSAVIAEAVGLSLIPILLIFIAVPTIVR